MKDSRSRLERMTDDYEDAYAEYGKDEAVHVCSEKWGLSIYRTLKEIEKIEEATWLKTIHQRWWTR